MGYHFDVRSDTMLNDEHPKLVYVGLEELEAEISEASFRLAMRKKLDRSRRPEKKP